jgi:hypothetical protein
VRKAYGKMQRWPPCLPTKLQFHVAKLSLHFGLSLAFDRQVCTFGTSLDVVTFGVFIYGGACAGAGASVGG